MPKQPRADLAEKTSNDLRPWLTTTQMCQVLNVTRQYLSQLIAEGEVRGSRLHKRAGAPYRFHPDEPARYFAANAIQRSA